MKEVKVIVAAALVLSLFYLS